MEALIHYGYQLKKGRRFQRMQSSPSQTAQTPFQVLSIFVLLQNPLL
jgi:hypothetical protein